ncbi:1-phosphofructokinase [Priestia taiwanensis]|uniref:Tagatose-6-phosphate kinase n=1 Tax=Priestia taiwanensis TaxID=1347902 RepID=A0A917ARB2_9BACI|nr:1-phosphofructokinase [Priestia taiwanensis]MBM7363836.1 1-phosphofructokinase [Priestia taiwanensis]GGE69387.1 1-phosphofructokinase [Priestia taiwanensis]
MIYTVTLNPSVDYIVEVNDFQTGHLHRMKREEKFPGGKGINVSRVLTRMNVPTKALGFIGGFTGDYIKETLQEEGTSSAFISVEGDSRINIKLKSGQETEINGDGPSITEFHIKKLFQQLEAVEEGSIVVVGGSIPSSLPRNLYEMIVRTCSQKGIRVVVDASGEALRQAILAQPFLIKPNQYELEELFETKIHTLEEAIPFGRKLVEMGAQHVIVSMGALGAALCTDNRVYIAHVPPGDVINSIGAGDSLVAGFIGTYWRTNDKEEAFKIGVATGSATAFSHDLCTVEHVQQLVGKVHIREI